MFQMMPLFKPLAEIVAVVPRQPKLFAVVKLGVGCTPVCGVEENGKLATLNPICGSGSRRYRQTDVKASVKV